jgi:hypothetical protein
MCQALPPLPPHLMDYHIRMDEERRAREWRAAAASAPWMQGAEQRGPCPQAYGRGLDGSADAHPGAAFQGLREQAARGETERHRAAQERDRAARERQRGSRARGTRASACGVASLFDQTRAGRQVGYHCDRAAVPAVHSALARQWSGGSSHGEAQDAGDPGLVGPAFRGFASARPTSFSISRDDRRTTGDGRTRIAGASSTDAFPSVATGLGSSTAYLPNPGCERQHHRRSCSPGHSPLGSSGQRPRIWRKA